MTSWPAARPTARGSVGVLLALLMIFAWVGMCTRADAAEGDPLRFAVLAFRPKPETQARWQPIADYLADKIPDRRIVFEPLSYPELEEAVREHRVDLVLTQPAHYVALSSAYDLYSPLATLVDVEQDRPLTQFGGVVVVQAGNLRLRTLSDLRHKRIATSNRESLGGFLAQAYELLERGIRVSELQVTETSEQDAALLRMASGQADAAFVRTGLLEQMAREGKIRLADFRIIRAEGVPAYPLILSTRLYPQWALAAMPWLEETTARQIAGAVLSLPHDGPIAQRAKISGFTVPGDYRSVDRLMRALRVPPFDKRVSLQTVWEDHQPLVIALFTATLLLGLWGARAYLQSQRQRLRAQQDLAESELHFRNLANSGTTLIWTAGPDGLCDYFNDIWLKFTGRSLQQELGNGWAEGVHPEDVAPCLAGYTAALARRDPFCMQYRLRAASGEYRWIIDYGSPRYDSHGDFIGYIGHCYDITDRVEAEQQLRRAASVFDHASEGIVITDPTCTIVEVNEAFTRITGYAKEEVLGKNPHLLSSGRQTPEFYQAMWQSLQQAGEWSGEIWNRRRDGKLYAELLTITSIRNDQGDVQQYVGLFHDITQQKEHQRELEVIAHYDALTGLPNRLLLADRMMQAMAFADRRKTKVAVIYLDLDGFKSVNDTYGHGVGDQLLTTMAERMKTALRDGDTLARLGGDEFVAVLSDLDSPDAAIPVLDRLLQVVALPAPVESASLRVTASIGVSFYPQAEAVDADQVLREADHAMYQAKRAGKNRYQLFDAEGDRMLRGHHESIRRIREALEAGEFTLYYQPKLNLRTGAVVGMEALIRWRHPEQGLLAPGLFLPLINDHELVEALGDWVIENVLVQMETWQAADIHLPVSVNIAARQMQASEFLGKLKAALGLHPKVAHQLELEILETGVLEDMTRMSQLIRACKKMGVAFALDDFGTGYSSLSYLKRLPAETLKIDQTFVRDMLEDPDDLAILDAIIGLAESFQRKVVAEGVETWTHAEMLLRMGCELAQGYAIARPMPGEEVARWLHTSAPQRTPNPLPRVARDRLEILFATTDLRAWVKALDRYLTGKSDTPPNLDPQQSRLGKWLAGAGDASPGESANENTHPQGPVPVGQLAAQLQTLFQRAATLCQSPGPHGEAWVNGGKAEIEAMSGAVIEGVGGMVG